MAIRFSFFVAMILAVAGLTNTVATAQQVVYSSPACTNCAGSAPVFATQTFANYVPQPVVNSVPMGTYTSSTSFPVASSVVTMPAPVQTYATYQSQRVVSSVPSGTFTSATYPSIANSTFTTTTLPTQTYANYVPGPTTSTVPIGTYTSTVSRPISVLPVRPIRRSSPVIYSNSMPVGRSSMSSGVTSFGLAQSKAQRAANGGIRGHIGGSLGGASCEGVGWSNSSPQRAIEQCCYWGQKSPAQIGVSRGADGVWYACVLYR